MLRVKFFFFNNTATTEIYTLSLHDALPILQVHDRRAPGAHPGAGASHPAQSPRSTNRAVLDRKSTRLNSSHSSISYAVFCLKKKKINKIVHSMHMIAEKVKTTNAAVDLTIR